MVRQTGETITGEEAKDLGIVVDAVAKEEVLVRCRGGGGCCWFVVVVECLLFVNRGCGTVAW